MVYRIQEVRPALKISGSAVDASEEKPAMAYDSTSEIIMFSEESWLAISLSWLKTSIMFLLSAMLIFTVMYVTLASSLLFATPVEGKVTVVARDTFLGGIPNIDDTALASVTQEAGKNPLDRLMEAAMGVKESQIVKISSLPTDTIAINGDNFAVIRKVQGKEQAVLTGTGAVMVEGQRATSSFTLNEQYLATCVSGNCTPGEFVVVEDKKIFGEVVDIEGMK